MTEQAQTKWLRIAIELALLQRDSHRLQEVPCCTFGLSQSYRIEPSPANDDLDMIDALQEKWDAMWGASQDDTPEAA